MEPFDLSVSQVNFEEQEFPAYDDISSFSNLVCYDSDFKGNDSEGIPVRARRLNAKEVLSLEQGLPQEEPDIEQIIQKNAAASYLHNYYSTDSAQSDIAKIAVQNKAKKTNAASYLHNYEGIGSRQKEVNKKTPQNKVSDNMPSEVNLKGADIVKERHDLADRKMSGSSSSSHKEKSMILDPHNDSFKAFTETVEALALQKSVIGSSDIVPASEDEIARVIAETQAKLQAAAPLMSATDAEYDQLDGASVTVNEAYSADYDGGSILATMMQDENMEVQMTEISDDRSNRSGGGQVTDTSTEAHPSNTEVFTESNGGTDYNHCDDRVPSPPMSPPDLIRVPAGNITRVTEKSTSWFSRKSPGSGSPASSPAKQANKVTAPDVAVSAPSKQDHEDVSVELSNKVQEGSLQSQHVQPNQNNLSSATDNHGSAPGKPQVVDKIEVKIDYSGVKQIPPPSEADVADFMASSPISKPDVADKFVPFPNDSSTPASTPVRSAAGEHQRHEAVKQRASAPHANQSHKDKSWTENFYSKYISSGPPKIENPDMEKKPHNVSCDDLNNSHDNQEVDNLQKENAKLQGQLEIMAMEVKVALKERAELQSQLGAVDQQLRSQKSNAQGIIGDRDALTADLETLRQNRTRLEYVIIDAQKLLEEKDIDIDNLQDDVKEAQEVSDKLQENIKTLKQSLQVRDDTVGDLKSKVAELYVDFQTTNQNKILAECEIQSLQSEIKSLGSAKEWYQEQLHLAQKARTDLQKEVTQVKSEMIAQGTIIERLKAEQSRVKQNLSETQQKALREKELLARHLETIESDMLEREAAFLQIQQERESMRHALDNHEPTEVFKVPAEITEELRVAKNDLKRRIAQIGVLEHEQAELVRRITLSQESILERDNTIENMDKKSVDVEVNLKQSELQLESKDQEILSLKDVIAGLEVELNASQEEKKTFDAALNTLKGDMGKVEESFINMKRELQVKTKQVYLLKSEKMNSPRDLATIHVERTVEKQPDIIEEAKQRSASNDFTDARQVDENVLQELENLKAEKSNIQACLDAALVDKQEVVELREAKKALVKQAEELSAEIDGAKSHVVSVESEREEIQKDLIVSKERLIEMGLTIRGLTEGKEDLEARLQSMQQQHVEETTAAREEAAAAREIAVQEAAAAKDTATQEAAEAKETMSSEQDTEIQNLKSEYSALQTQYASLQTESHKEIAKLRAKSLKLGKDLEGTLRKSKEDHRQIQGELDELKRQKEADIENKSRLQSELENLQRHFSSNLDEKTEHLQEELQASKASVDSLESNKQALESRLREAIQQAETREESLSNSLQDVTKDLNNLQTQYDTQKQTASNNKQLILELEKERGKLADLLDVHPNRKLHPNSLELDQILLESHQTLKAHANSLEQHLAKRESSVVELSSHAQSDLQKKGREVILMQEQMRELEDSLIKEKKNTKDAKKQYLTEKGAHAKLKRKMESSWVDNDETMATAEQQAQQLASLQAKLGQEQEAEKSLRLQVERMEMERKALQREHDRLEREMADRKAKDPVIDHQIQTFDWEVKEKSKEISALKEQLMLVQERQSVELDTLRNSLKNSNTEMAGLKDEIMTVKREKASLQSKVAELKGAIKASMQHTKDARDSSTAAPLPFDISEIEKLLQDVKPVAMESKPLSYLKETLSGLRGEISCLQQQVDVHTSTVQNSSMAWKELEAQVKDLQEVCASSAADRAAAVAVPTEQSEAQTSPSSAVPSSPPSQTSGMIDV